MRSKIIFAVFILVHLSYGNVEFGYTLGVTINQVKHNLGIDHDVWSPKKVKESKSISPALGLTTKFTCSKSCMLDVSLAYGYYSTKFEFELSESPFSGPVKSNVNVKFHRIEMPVLFNFVAADKQISPLLSLGVNSSFVLSVPIDASVSAERSGVSDDSENCTDKVKRFQNEFVVGAGMNYIMNEKYRIELCFFKFISFSNSVSGDSESSDFFNFYSWTEDPEYFLLFSRIQLKVCMPLGRAK